MKKLKVIVALLRGERGQAMTEYSLIAGFLFFVSAPVAVLGIWPTFMNAYNTYIHSFYWVLNFPFP
jgi:Flp pilus assembly pilin Flp